MELTQDELLGLAVAVIVYAATPSPCSVVHAYKIADEFILHAKKNTGGRK